MGGDSRSSASTASRSRVAIRKRLYQVDAVIASNKTGGEFCVPVDDGSVAVGKNDCPGKSFQSVPGLLDLSFGSDEPVSALAPCLEGLSLFLGIPRLTRLMLSL